MLSYITRLARPATLLRYSATVRYFSLASTSSPLSLLRRQQITPLSNPTSVLSASPAAAPTPLASTESPSIFSNLLSLGGQRRWKARGNTYQPNTYKRKKTLGFMSRMRSKTGRKIIARRREKGRWYIAH